MSSRIGVKTRRTQISPVRATSTGQVGTSSALRSRCSRSCKIETGVVPMAGQGRRPRRRRDRAGSPYGDSDCRTRTRAAVVNDEGSGDVGPRRAPAGLQFLKSARARSLCFAYPWAAPARGHPRRMLASAAASMRLHKNVVTVPSSLIQRGDNKAGKGLTAPKDGAMAKQPTTRWPSSAVSAAEANGAGRQSARLHAFGARGVAGARDRCRARDRSDSSRTGQRAHGRPGRSSLRSTCTSAGRKALRNPCRDDDRDRDREASAAVGPAPRPPWLRS